MFIARAIYDGAVTYRYITDAEVSKVRKVISTMMILAWRITRGRSNIIGSP